MKLFQTFCNTFADWERWVSDYRLYEYDQLTIFISSLSPSFRMQVEQYVQHHLPQAQLLPMIGDASEQAVICALVSDECRADLDEMRQKMKISEQYYRSLFEHNPDIVYSTDLEGNFTSVNPVFEQVFGYKADEILHTNSLDYIKEEDIPRVRRYFYRTLKGKVQQYNLEIPSKTGEVRLFQIKNVPIIVDGKKVGVYGIGRDITEQKRAEEHIKYIAYHDVDTGLPNRLKFTNIVKQAINEAKGTRGTLAVLFIDMDRFKIVNDTIGHYGGDEILKQMAERIKKILPAGAHLGRFGGDKFSLLLTKRTDAHTVIEWTKKLLQHIALPIVYEEKEFFLTASVGVSFYPADGVDAQSLLKNADTAVNRAKQKGGNSVMLYATKMNEQVMYRVELERYLRKALEKNECFLVYQPLLDLVTGKIVGSEALLRWKHPKIGFVSPLEFIPLAEEIGFIHDLGRWVLTEACMQTKKWHDLGFHSLMVSVNVSASQFQHPMFFEDVQRALKQSQLPAHCLHLELTESSMLRNMYYSIQVMKQLQQLGVHVSIDDFGTGYSSLSYLKDLPINTLKIDRSFIYQLHKDRSDIAIVKSIITMGHGLRLKVVAEGVETAEQMKLLKRLKCHYAQGYAIFKPLSAEQFEQQVLQGNVVIQ
ncbi:EAL domain-containing protein [Anoxybacillus sp. LAT_35]|uniref:putative bifunctional diguanylate cyclase/phosphodiesterase n=1 Tax=Anoxybacillus TaxID=150247 RepID=UPI001EDA835B|nr:MULTISPECIES: EAL domain-containing protein [Anoxybacillus]MCG5025422.1 EAL domain-containing protein [Anoxybacillus flavithermus]MCG6196234.1 EAL domain-containing protein [Anoxybacillus sp. LAT_38]MCG3083751.1 EAL domain-containing protein [Anoxybacillus sp. LAT27]MCG6170447.1 EAL domain-containing protein [Anoxybacillus sp. LAT_11]MCG6175395.1 EAL domain-containing protein [Anoxybacillus sp. LAT_31]